MNWNDIFVFVHVRRKYRVTLAVIVVEKRRIYSYSRREIMGECERKIERATFIRGLRQGKKMGL